MPPKPTPEQSAGTAPSLRINYGGSPLSLDLPRLPEQMTVDEVEQAVIAAGFSSRQEFLDAHRLAIRDAVRERRDVPARVIFDFPGYMRPDLSDAERDEAYDNAVDIWRKTKSHQAGVDAMMAWPWPAAVFAINPPKPTPDFPLPPSEHWGILIDAIRFYATARDDDYDADAGLRATQALNAVGEEIRRRPEGGLSSDDGRKAAPIVSVAAQVLEGLTPKVTPKAALLTVVERERLDDLRETSKNDRTIIVGSDIRWCGMLIDRLEAALTKALAKPTAHYSEGPCRKCDKIAQTHAVHEVADIVVCLNCWDVYTCANNKGFTNGFGKEPCYFKPRLL